MHERSPNSSSALTGKHKEFLYFSPVLRIRFGGQSQLDRADDLTRLARYEKHAGVRPHFVCLSLSRCASPWADPNIMKNNIDADSYK
ncbi:hypothetical protein ccbrp13_25270 [Ktedonobacteria bacterium brp13]|nr:hypothetical protein ccbrp13_25270 [Ktedonobacteria bacterium brp13]